MGRTWPWIFGRLHVYISLKVYRVKKSESKVKMNVVLCVNSTSFVIFIRKVEGQKTLMTAWEGQGSGLPGGQLITQPVWCRCIEGPQTHPTHGSGVLQARAQPPFSQTASTWQTVDPSLAIQKNLLQVEKPRWTKHSWRQLRTLAWPGREALQCHG